MRFVCSAVASIVVGVAPRLLQRSQANVPEALVLAEPFIGLRERLRIEPAVVRAFAYGALARGARAYAIVWHDFPDPMRRGVHFSDPRGASDPESHAIQ